MTLKVSVTNQKGEKLHDIKLNVLSRISRPCSMQSSCSRLP